MGTDGTMEGETFIKRDEVGGVGFGGILGAGPVCISVSGESDQFGIRSSRHSLVITRIIRVHFMCHGCVDKRIRTLKKSSDRVGHHSTHIGHCRIRCADIRTFNKTGVSLGQPKLVERYEEANCEAKAMPGLAEPAR